MSVLHGEHLVFVSVLSKYSGLSKDKYPEITSSVILVYDKDSREPNNMIIILKLELSLSSHFHPILQSDNLYSASGPDLVCVTAYGLKHECVRFSLVDTTLVSGSGPMGAGLETCSGFWKRHLI